MTNPLTELLEQLTSGYFAYDDPNGPYRCSLCHEPLGDAHEPHCAIELARALQDPQVLEEAVIEYLKGTAQ